jgi:hypothetical protein
MTEPNEVPAVVSPTESTPSSSPSRGNDPLIDVVLWNVFGNNYLTTFQGWLSAFAGNGAAVAIALQVFGNDPLMGSHPKIVGGIKLTALAITSLSSITKIFIGRKQLDPKAAQ